MRRSFSRGIALAAILVFALAAPAAATGPSTVVTDRLLERAAPIAGANGLAFGRDGTLYVGSAGSGITALDPDSGRILAFYGPDQGVWGADDVAAGPDGAIYFTSLLTGEVGRLVPGAAHATAVVQLPLGVNPVAFSDDGRLFVGLALLGDALYEVDPSGAEAPRLINSGLGLNGFDWSAGYLWAPRMYTGQLVKIDVQTGAYAVVASGFAFPTAADMGPDGFVYVTDSGSGRVFRVDPASGSKTVIATLGVGLDNLAFDARGGMFVSNSDSGAVVEILPNGKGRPVSPAGLVTGPAGLAVLPSTDGHERLYAADLFTLYGFDGTSGRTLDRWSGGFGSVGGPALPLTVGAAGDDLALSSWFSGVVQLFDPATGTALHTCPAAVPLNALGFDGALVVSQLGTNSVVRLDPATCATTTVATLAVPTGLAARDGDLWVADWYLGMVFQLVDDGAVIPATPVAAGLVAPEGLAVAPDGGLLVVEAGAHRVSSIDLASGTVTPIITGLANGVVGPPTMPPTYIFDGIAVGPSGTIYVSANGIHRYELRP